MTSRAPSRAASSPPTLQPALLSLDPQPDPFGKLLTRLNVGAQPGWPDAFGHALRQELQTAPSSPIRTLSLFSGAGGLDIGFHDAGFTILEMVEIDSRFVETLKANTGKDAYLDIARPNCIDIAAYTASNLRDIDFIIGGPPCQSWSAAGRRANGVRGINDDRGRLFEEYVRLLEKLKPAGFLFENVYGITGANNGQSWPLIVHAFSEIGYKLHYRVLDAADYGVPQHRERMFIVGVQEGEYNFPLPTHGPDSPSIRPHYTAGQAIADVQNSSTDGGLGGRYGHLLDGIPPGLNYSFYTAEMGHPSPLFAWRSKFSDFLYKADPSQPVRTIKAQGGQYTGPFHWESRPFSVQELKRLQTFPDSYRLSGGRQVAVHQLGNSVPPQIGRILALSIRQQIFGVGSDLPLLPTMPADYQLGFRRRKRDRTKQYQSAARVALESSRVARTDPILKAFNRRFELPPDLVLAPSRKGPWRVQFRPGRKSWSLSIWDQEVSENPKAQLQISPTRASKTWTIGVEQISIDIFSARPEGVLVAWRGLERAVIEGGLKGDLVQLAGYYQYRPSFDSHLRADFEDFEVEQPELWRLLASLTRGKGIRRIIPATELASELEVCPENLGNLLVSAKKLGFEVRNDKTNPEIPSNHYLIPYHFPTLTGASVQFSKRL